MTQRRNSLNTRINRVGNLIQDDTNANTNHIKERSISFSGGSLEGGNRRKDNDLSLDDIGHESVKRVNYERFTTLYEKEGSRNSSSMISRNDLGGLSYDSKEDVVHHIHYERTHVVDGEKIGNHPNHEQKNENGNLGDDQCSNSDGMSNSRGLSTFSSFLSSLGGGSRGR